MNVIEVKNLKKNIASLAIPDAAERIASEALGLCRGRGDGVMR